MRLPSLVALSLLVAAGTAHGDAAGDAALANVDTNLNKYKTLTFDYDVTTAEPGRGEKKLALTVFVKGDRRLTEFTAPADLKGTKVLVVSPTEMYAYLPAFGKVRRIASHTSDQSAFGMAFSQDDLAVQRYSPDYTATTGASDDTGTWLTLAPKPGKAASYAKVEIQVLKENGLPGEIKYYGPSGTLWKTEARTGYQCKNEVCVPGALKMIDHSKGGLWTLITNKTWKLDEAVDDNLLSKRTLDK